jgi:hypothetical protein
MKVSIPFRIYESVSTPNGPGVFWGPYIDQRGELFALVAHRPADAPALRDFSRGGPCFAIAYPFDVIKRRES